MSYLRLSAHLRFSMSVGAMAEFLPTHRHSHAGCQLLRDCTWQQRFTVLPSLRTHASKHLRATHNNQCKSSRAQRLRCRGESHNGNGSKETSERSSAIVSVLPCYSARTRGCMHDTCHKLNAHQSWHDICTCKLQALRTW